MALINGTITISDSSMLSAALQSKVMNPGVRNERVDYCIDMLSKTQGDRELINLCEKYMKEIARERRNSRDGVWRWESPKFNYSSITRDLTLIGEIVGCWLGEDCFYTNQTHVRWQF